MKKRLIWLIVILLATAAFVALIVLPRSAKPEGGELIERGPHPEKARVSAEDPGHLSARAVFTPPLKWMRQANVRPDIDRCRLDSPVQRYWMVTQRRTVDDVLKVYVDEAKEGIIRRANSSRLPYYASEKEQIAAATKAMDRFVLGTLGYTSLAKEDIVVVVVSGSKSGVGLGILVDRGRGWRAMNNYQQQGGLDVHYLVNYLMEEIGTRRPQALPGEKRLLAIGKKAMATALEEERKELSSATSTPVNNATSTVELLREADKCRLYLLKFPKSIFLKEVHERLSLVNGLLVSLGQPSAEPYKDFYDYMKKKGKKP